MLLAAASVFFCVSEAKALDASHYASQSALNSGKWVKVKVGETGMYLLSNQFLRNQGFSDPSKVNVYGFGGRMAPDVLTTDAGDDLPLLPCVRTDKGIVFYATDNIIWKSDNTHVQHAYCDESYYFLSDREAEPSAIGEAEKIAPVSSGAPVRMFNQRLLHEKDLTSPANTGRIILGEDFRTQTSRSFSFDTPGLCSSPFVKVVFGAKVSGGSSSFAVSANKTPLNGNGTTIPSVSTGEGFLRLGTYYGMAPVHGDKLDINVGFSYSGTLATAALDYIEVVYERSLEIPASGNLAFNLNPAVSSNVEIGNVTASTEVWDVTVPHCPLRVAAEISGGKAIIAAPAGYREYVAFTPEKVSAVPSAVGSVANQDIHGLPVPDMVVISPKEYMASAERVAQMRRDVDGYTVYVFTPEQIYNEFTSGSKDVGAFRKMLKMWVDRAKAEGSDPTRFCLIWGKPDYNFKSLKRDYVTVPIWLSPEGLSQSTSYSTDYYIGMTDDCTTFDIGSQKIRVAVGRLPVKSPAEAEIVADKLVRYVTKPDFGNWRNQTMIVADDQDNGVHLDQAERFYAGAQGNGMGANYLYERIYLDAYPLEFSSVGPAYPKAKARMLKMIDDGVAHFTYIGHASTRGWGHEHLFKWRDITSLTNKRLPFIYAATCEFGRWDNDDICASEHMLLNTSGGVIGIITPSRTVYITNNGLLTKEMGPQLFKRGKDGKGVTIGESFVAAMNSMTNSDDNKLRYCIISDPALRLPMPERTARIETINNVDIADATADMPVVPALGRISVSGSVTLPDGSVDTSFSGTVIATLYDAEIPVTTYGNGEKGVVSTYNDRKTRLLTDKAAVKDGRFEFTLFMPAEIENNWSPALLNLYAYSDNGVEANGATEKLYLYGFNDDALTDNEGPEIRRFTLNDDSFRSGDKTHRTPLVLATLADPSGINLSDGGIGHKLTLILDGHTVYDDLVSYYSSDSDERGAGQLSYSLPEVEPGKHTLKLVAWDNVNNSSTAELEFIAEFYRKPTIYDVTTDVNPATTSVRFTVSHDMPSVAATCTVSVYDLAGRKVWSGSAKETFAAGSGVDISWNLTDGNGNRVPKGIYVYRAVVETPDGVEASKSRRLLVAGE